MFVINRCRCYLLVFRIHCLSSKVGCSFLSLYVQTFIDNRLRCYMYLFRFFFRSFIERIGRTLLFRRRSWGRSLCWLTFCTWKCCFPFWTWECNLPFRAWKRCLPFRHWECCLSLWTCESSLRFRAWECCFPFRA